MAITNPLGQTTAYSYDPVGNQITQNKPDGNTINYNYDNKNRLLEIIYPDTNKVSFNYDPNGNRTKMIDPQGTTLYNYDNLNRLTTVTRDAYSIGYSYDLTGNITGITYPDGLNISYTYNQINRLQSVTDAVYTATFTYNELGNIIGQQLPNGITVDYQYDDSVRLISLKHLKGNTVLSGVEYTLDNIGNRLSITDENGGITSYTYNQLSQLTKVEYPDNHQVTYTYDPVGNRLSAGGTNYSYDSANRLIQKGGIPYNYDPNGNLISVGEAVYYDYDYQNRLIHFVDNNNTYQYTYDGDGNRLTQTVTGAVYESYNYIYDINAGLPLLLVEKDSQGNTNNYLYANSLYGRIGTDGILFYHADGLGSVSVITDVYGEQLNRYTYDAFGNPLTVTETVDNMFRFTGEPYDPSGLVFLRARYYDPTTGRFLTQDTYLGELNDPLSQNLYVYCSNNPVLYIDPSGNIAICIPAVPYAAAGAAALGTAAVGATVVLAEEIGNFFAAKKKSNEEYKRPIKYPGNDPSKSPGSGWEWRGKGEPGSSQGSWYNPKTKESLHPDLNHPGPIGPHWDYKAPDGKNFRLNPDGSLIPK